AAAGARRGAPRLARLLREALGRLLPPRPRPALPSRRVAARPLAQRRRLRPRLAPPARRDLRAVEVADGLLAALHLVPRRHVSGAVRRPAGRPSRLPGHAAPRLGVRHDALRQRPLPGHARARPQARRHGRAPARRPLPHGRARLGTLRLLRLLPPPAQFLSELLHVRPLLLGAAHLPLPGAALLPDDAPPGEDGPRPRARARRLAFGGCAPRTHRLEPPPERAGDGAGPHVSRDADGDRPRRPRAAPTDARHRGLGLLF